MRTNTLLKQEPAKPRALLEAKTARSTGIDRRVFTLRGLEVCSAKSMIVSLDDTMIRGSDSSMAVGESLISRLLGSVYVNTVNHGWQDASGKTRLF